MTADAFQKIGVVGAGQMGQGIAQVCATSGFNVILQDISEKQLATARASIERSLSKLVEKEKITTSVKDDSLTRLTMTAELQALKDCDLVIEAIIESEAIKTELFQKLDQMLPEGAILASNTSSIPITRLAAATNRPDQVIGMHFMNPVPLMSLVEVIRGLTTSEATDQRICALVAALGKETSRSQDFPGFVVNRILMPMINEAFFTLMEGVANAEDIDKGMKLGCNLPMGPLTLADFIGLDTCLAIMRVIHDGTQDPKHRPCPLLVKYVEAGRYGRKTKQGVYSYS